MPQKQGNVLLLPSQPSIIANAAVVGKVEGEGPLAQEFDFCYPSDTINGMETWEKSESELHRDAVDRAIKKSGVLKKDIDIMFAGDLLNQCIGTTFGIMDFDIPFAGLFGACSTMAMALAMAGVFCDSGAAQYAVASASSHFCSAEKQFRFPLEYGGQRSPTAQRTVTGAGAAVMGAKTNAPFIEAVLFGKVQNYGITDAANMGAAMAPAAASTISDFLRDTNTKPEDYDIILTGDLGSVGSNLLKELLKTKHNFDISAIHNDCGLMIFEQQQDTHAGGSGCGCSASVFNSVILRRLGAGELKKVLLVGTGALMSPTSAQQKSPIPSVAHAVCVCSD
ncbi:MAG: stage V sporulation protein AD [Oscillospiraceae bacterium]|jgi:stage V sporulation protein AD|nr:stage V sporulation protein AD [Oscillospiraceae bacterium]